MLVTKVSTLAAVAALVASCSYGPYYELPAPKPPWKCYLLSTDTSPPTFVPRTLALGQNKLGSSIWLAAAIKPNRFTESGTSRPLGARWYHLPGDSVEIEWYIPGTVFGSVGVVLAVLTQDSLSGRVAHGSDMLPLGPWAPIVGRPSSCKAGA